MKINKKVVISAAIISFTDIVKVFEIVGQDMLDSGVDYNCIRRLQNVNIKLEELINILKGELV